MKNEDLNFIDQIQSKVHFIRGYRVMLDADLAKLYGVETKALNQAVRRNLERFPPDASCSNSLKLKQNLQGHQL